MINAMYTFNIGDRYVMVRTSPIADLVNGDIAITPEGVFIMEDDVLKLHLPNKVSGIPVGEFSKEFGDVRCNARKAIELLDIPKRDISMLILEQYIVDRCNGEDPFYWLPQSDRLEYTNDEITINETVYKVTLRFVIETDDLNITKWGVFDRIRAKLKVAFR